MSERRTIRRWYWVWDFDKEELWLNEMANCGWVLDGVGLCTYHFVRCEPGEYNVRLQLQNADTDYVDFVGNTGAEYVGRMLQWVFFRKKTEDGGFDLFSDIDSRVRHLDKIAKMLLVIGMANLAIGLLNVWNPARIGWINLLCCALLMYALGRIHGKKEALERDRLLHE